MNINRFAELFGVAACNPVKPSVADRAFEHCTRLKIDVMEYQGEVEASFELHGDLCCERDDDGETTGRADLGLLADLRERFKQKGGDL